MKKSILKQRTETTYNTTADALKLIYDNLNHGQQQKILKNEEVKELLIFYGVIEE